MTWDGFCGLIPDAEEFRERLDGFGSVYCWDRAKDVRLFCEKIGLTGVLLVEEDLTGETPDWVKEFFNPLLKNQDILFFSEGYVVTVAFRWVELIALGVDRAADDLIRKYCKLCEPDKRELFVLLVEYGITKDVSLLSEIAQGEWEFDLHCFKKLDSIFENGVLDETILQTVLDGLGQSIQGVRERPVFYSDGGEKRKKNVVVLHLESLSNEIYHNHVQRMPDLEKLFGESLRFSKFFSTATSSAMAVADFLFGNDYEVDRFSRFHDIDLENSYVQNLFQIVREHGYETYGLGYNRVIATEEINGFKLWNVAGQTYDWVDEFDVFLNRLERFVDDNCEKPFALHIWNLITHIGHKDVRTDQVATFTERMNVSYELLNETVAVLVKKLEEYGLLDDTVIVCYGDHGDDKWTRAIGSGCTHIIEPYLNVIATPAAIYAKGLRSGWYEGLVSLIDLKQSILFLLGIEQPRKFDFEGINIFSDANEVVFSRNFLTNQVTKDIIQDARMIRLNHFGNVEVKNKSFCVVSAKYNMLIDCEGIALFLHTIDPGNYSNLLRFFVIDSDGDIVGFDNRGAWKGHFRSIMMVDAQIYEIIGMYYRLKEVLVRRIAGKQQFLGAENEFDFSGINLIKGK